MTDEEVCDWLVTGVLPGMGSLFGHPVAGELGSPLLEWTFARRVAIRRSIDPALARLVEASRNLSVVEFSYLGGTRPGSRRWVQPSVIFEVIGFPGIFVTGWCREIHWIRTFRFDRMQLSSG